jgi:hypothetical protein
MFPGSVKPTVKVGLSAPFEGRYRDLGYEVLFAVRLAVRERNDAGGVRGRYLVEFVALNDFDEPREAIIQAHKMEVDPGVLGVLGGWSLETAQKVAPIYGDLGLPVLFPDVDITSSRQPLSLDSDFEAAYREISGGAPPGLAAVWAYEAANRLLNVLDQVAGAGGEPTRARVQDVLVR